MTGVGADKANKQDFHNVPGKPLGMLVETTEGFLGKRKHKPVLGITQQ